MQPRFNFLDGELRRALGTNAEDVVVSLADHRLLEETFRQGDRRFRDLLDALPAAVYTTDAKGRITYYNEAAVELWGHRPALGTSEWCGSWKIFTPDGRLLPHDQCPMAIALKEDRAVRGVEAQAERPDGTRVPFLPFPTPLHDDTGKLIGAVNMLIDITERKKAEEKQALLIREMHHRVKNTLATLQAIMNSTARTAATIEDFQQAFIGRVAALTRTHTLLIEGCSQTARFEDMLRGELEVYDDGNSMRVRLAGPSVELSSHVAVPLGMAVHELTTNAAKYGALSVAGGSVEVNWSETGTNGSRQLDMNWVERGGPRVAPPAHEGFGSRLLGRVLTDQVEAETRLDYAVTGLSARFSIPLR